MQSDRIPAWKRLGLELKNASTSTQERAVKRQKTDAQASNERKRDLVKTTNGVRVKSDRSQILKESHVNNEAKAERISDESVAAAEEATAQSFEPRQVDDEVSRERRMQRKREARENRPQRKVDAAPSENDGARSYVGYLQLYHHDRPNWKFNKALQTALLRNCLNLYRVPPELDEALLEYISGLQGQGARIRLAEEAKKILEEPDTCEWQLPATSDMKYIEAPAGLSAEDVEGWKLHMENKRKFFEQWNASSTLEAENPEAVAKKRDFEEFMARLRRTGAAEDALKLEHDYNKLRHRRAQEILNAVKVLMDAMITKERLERDRSHLATGKPTKPRNHEFAPKVVNRSKKSRGKKRRTAASTSSSSSSSSDTDSSSDTSESDSG